jgi:hypothetical protein
MMPPITRRSFLAWISTAVPLTVIARRAHALSVDSLTRELGPSRTMLALGEIVLPTELGSAGVARVVGDFQRWLEGYREHAELVHGYGTSRIRFTGPSPATRWASQLDALDAAARKAHSRAFAELPVAERSTLVRQALGSARVDRMPSPMDASHVALALIAFFYDSSEATDLCYEAAIGKQHCRPLRDSSKEPVALKRSLVRRIGAKSAVRSPQSASE